MAEEKKKKVNHRFVPRKTDQGTDHPVYQQMDGLIAAYHPDLATAKIAIAWKDFQQDKDGRESFGSSKVCNALDRQMHSFDAIISLNEDWWHDPKHTDREKSAFLDHCLCGIVPDCDQAEDQRQDENGELVWRKRAHDVEAFSEVIERYGVYTKGLEKAESTMLVRRQREEANEVI